MKLKLNSNRIYPAQIQQFFDVMIPWKHNVLTLGTKMLKIALVYIHKYVKKNESIFTEVHWEFRETRF